MCGVGVMQRLVYFHLLEMVERVHEMDLSRREKHTHPVKKTKHKLSYSNSHVALLSSIYSETNKKTHAPKNHTASKTGHVNGMRGYNICV